jgi:hypothetical protein
MWPNSKAATGFAPKQTPLKGAALRLSVQSAFFDPLKITGFPAHYRQKNVRSIRL